MRLTTWNVNGIRNPFSYPPWNTARTFSAMFDILASDIVVMQELKIQRKDLRDDMVLVDGWDCYFSLPKHKKGYSGVSIYTRNATCSPIRAEEGLLGVLPNPSGTPYCELPADQSIGGYPSLLQVTEIGVDPVLLDSEGRCVVVEFPAFVLLGVYSPANSNGLRDDFRYGFICALDCRIRNLIKMGKRVVLVGDLNVSREELDCAGSVDDIRKAGMTHEEYISTPNRRVFNQLIIGGEVFGERDEGREQGVLCDTSRYFHPKRSGMYTHWETKVNARPGNFGSRIDFVLVSESMIPWLQDANIQEGLLGSDHCPVYADFKTDVVVDGESVNLLDIMSPPGTFKEGSRLIEWKTSTIPEFSGKRMPEFEKRRSIKSMFAAPASRPPQLSSVEISASPVQTREPSLSPIKQDPERPGLRSTPRNPSFTAASPLKRTISSPIKDGSAKKAKTDADETTPKGQKSLKGFFTVAPKNTSFNTSFASTVSDTSDTNGHGDFMSAVDKIDSKTDDANDGVRKDGSRPKTPPNQPTTAKDPARTNDSVDTSSTISPTKFATKLAAVEETQKTWGALFSRPVAPLCECHQEPCKSMLTKKKGSNQGRSFWMCARPLGPSGAKERNTEWRCPTFIWCSDWSKKVESG